MAAPLRRIVLLHEFTGCLTNAAAIDGLETFLRGAELTDVRRAELAAVFLKSIEGVALPVANELRTRITEVAIACEKLCNALRQALAEPFHPEIRVTWAQNWVPSACIELRRVPPDIFRQILDVGSDQISNDWGKHICAVAERGLSLLRLWDCDGRLAPEKDSCLSDLSFQLRFELRAAIFRSVWVKSYDALSWSWKIGQGVKVYSAV